MLSPDDSVRDVTVPDATPRCEFSPDITASRHELAQLIGKLLAARWLEQCRSDQPEPNLKNRSGACHHQ